MVPSLRGPVTAVNGTPVSAMKTIPQGAWILRGDRGLTYATDIPQGNRVVAGKWWAADYSGPPLVLPPDDFSLARLVRPPPVGPPLILVKRSFLI